MQIGQKKTYQVYWIDCYALNYVQHFVVHTLKTSKKSSWSEKKVIFVTLYMEHKRKYVWFSLYIIYILSCGIKTREYITLDKFNIEIGFIFMI